MNPAAQLARDIVVALTTTLAAVVAFYFGTKVAQEAGEKQTEVSVSPKASENGKPKGETLHATITRDLSVTEG